jgi:cytochrome c-type biogenesis protein CcmH/NrfG
MNVDELPKEKTKRLKEKIILQKFSRISEKKFKNVSKKSNRIFIEISKMGRRIVQKLYALEQRYKKLQKGDGQDAHATKPETIKRLLDEAADFIRKEEYFEAEKRLIEIISHNPKNIDAYEALGNLYIREKKHEQAKEALQYAVKIDKENASIYVSLGELAMLNKDPSKALEEFRKAVEIRPHNPRYLDFYIEAALQALEREDAEKGIEMLLKVNSENKKIEEFNNRLESL